MNPEHHLYPLYGRHLASTIPFPELDPVPESARRGEGGEEIRPRWHFEVVDHLAPVEGAVLLGEEPLYAEVRARFLSHPEGYRIEVDDTGIFSIDSAAERILWQPTDDPWWDFGRAHLLGRVLSLALHLDGLLVLHGSAVALPDGVTGFLARKGAGKSTLALELTRQGGKLVTDDALPVDPRTTPPVAFPGVQTVRLRDGEGGGPAGRDGKGLITGIGEGSRMTEARPLAALYLLHPVRSNPGGEAARILPVSGPPALFSLLAHTKIGAMLGPTEAPDLLARLSTLLRQVPVYELFVLRDRDRLSEAAEVVRAHRRETPGAGEP